MSAVDDATVFGQRLYGKDNVFLRIAENYAGSGTTPSGLYVEHSRGLPACFGEVMALGPGAKEAGIEKGQYVLFTRYAQEVTDILEDGTTFAVFDYHDLRGAYEL
jgi:co-chaperonin GroES (HSP10)